MIKSIGSRIVNLRPMTRLAYNHLRGWELPSNEHGEDAGYLVETLNNEEPNTQYYKGYVSWLPKAQVDATYNPVSAMTFGDALFLMKQGHKVARKGWNGRNMYALLHEPYTVNLGRKINSFFLLKNPNNTFSTWVPSVSDCLAEDWTIIN